ncbi:MAG TPA: hypothetical protein VJR29_02295 [bacterium]|nr:hypothetical protein [bacterium]
MKAALKTWLMVFAALAFSACGGGGSSTGSDWRGQPYDVPAGKSLNSVFQDISALSGISFTVDPVLQASLDADPPRLPILLGLNAAQVLVLIQDLMPPEQEYFYQELSAQSIAIIPRFQQAEDLSAAAPVTIIDFDTFAHVGFKALISDPQIEEFECGGPAGLGDGGIFEILTEVSSDPDGHSEFIGEFPPLVEYSIEGNRISFFGDPPWVTVGGAIQADGSFSASGSGTVAGFPDVSVEFLGQAQPGLLTGTLTMGAGGELPGGNPAVYSVHP